MECSTSSYYIYSYFGVSPVLGLTATGAFNASRLRLLQRWHSWTGNGTYPRKSSANHAITLVAIKSLSPRLCYAFPEIHSHSFTHLIGFEGTRCMDVYWFK